MPKNTLRFTFYLLFALAIGVVVTLLVNGLENIAEEKRFKKAVEQEIRSAVSSFKKAAPDANSDDVVFFLKEFTHTAKKGKVIAVEHGGERPDSKEFKLLFKFSDGDRKFDVYIYTAYLDEEVQNVDLADALPGVITTIIVFGAILIFTEKRQQTLRMQAQYERKQAELDKAMKEHEMLALLGRMSATLAHELKTPIATLTNLMHILPSRAADEEFIKRSAAMASEELTRTRQLIDNLLIYGKEISTTNDEWIDMDPFITALANKNGLKLVSCPNVGINGDKFYIKLLFDNLMRNSIQAGANQFSIIRGAADGEKAEILIEDNGAGFPDGADLGDLTNPFVTMRSKGAGLGLYLAERIVAAHEGVITLYRPGKGAGIRITLPEKRVKVYGKQQA